MTEIDKNNNLSMSTLCDTILKKCDDVIKILHEIKNQAPAVEKREKMKKGCTRKIPTYRSRRRKIQLHSVEEMKIENTETLSTKFVSSTLVVPASHKDGSIKSIDTNSGFNKLEKMFQVTESPFLEERSFKDSSHYEEVEVFVSPNSEISPDTAGITTCDKNQEVFVSTERQATNALQMFSNSGSARSLCLATTLIYVNAGDSISAA